VRIESKLDSNELLHLCVKNPDGSIVLVLFNETEKDAVIQTKINEEIIHLELKSHSILTLID
jgi:hypothetical protein